MSYRLKDRLKRTRYNFGCKGIFNTPPLRVRAAPLVFLSMASHKDLTMYLVAIKSIYRHFGEGRVVVINDGSFSKHDLGQLHHHIEGLEVLDIGKIETSPCPRGGMWERLLTAMDLCADCFVIQVDSDTVAVEAIPEVVEAYRSNRPFLLGTKDGQDFVSTAEAAAFVENNSSDHIQIVAERALARLPADGYRYIRGCAGFSGYARGRHSRADAEAWSRRMEGIVGRRWDEWGSEQVTSNLLIANSEDPLVLPYPRYANYHPAFDVSETHFLHFMGTHRFQNGGYVGASRRVIQELGGAS